MHRFKIQLHPGTDRVLSYTDINGNIFQSSSPETAPSFVDLLPALGNAEGAALVGLEGFRALDIPSEK